MPTRFPCIAQHQPETILSADSFTGSLSELEKTRRLHHTNVSRIHFCIELTHTRESVCPISDRAETIAAVAVTLPSSLNGTFTRTVRITDCNQRNTRLETPLECLPVLILNVTSEEHLSKCSDI